MAQVVYLDLRDHGRSARHDPADWSFEICADDVRAFCDVIGIVRPIRLKAPQTVRPGWSTCRIQLDAGGSLSRKQAMPKPCDGGTMRIPLPRSRAATEVAG